MNAADGRRLPWTALAILLAVPALAGCAEEVYKGPRVVHYTENSFYVRHLPLMNGARDVEALATDICQSGDQRTPVLREAYQDVPLGIRYATYDCM